MDTLLLTGASTGLGLAISRLLLPRDYHLILTARKSSLDRFVQEGIKETEKLWIRPLDVTSDDERRALINEINEKLGGVDILINNAGVSFRAVVEHVKEADRLLQMDVNFRSPMELIRLVLPSMRKNRRGRIVNVSSVGGMMAMPTMAVYSASKFAIEGATEALYYEVKPWGIHVSLVQPGFINSSSFQKVCYTDLSHHSQKDSEEAYFAHYEYMTPFITKMMGLSLASPKKVAKKILRTISRSHPPLRVAGTLDARLFALLRRFLPQKVYHWVLYRFLPHIKEWGPQD